MVRPTVNSRKHVNQLSPTTVAVGTLGATKNFISAVVAPDADNQIEVREGAIIKAIWVEVWLTSDDAQQGSFQVVIEKISSGGPDGTFSTLNSIGSYANKKNVLYITRGISSATGGTPLPVIRQWVAIPKSKQRFGLGDKLNINFSAIANGMTWCGFVLFKEYY